MKVTSSIFLSRTSHVQIEGRFFIIFWSIHACITKRGTPAPSRFLAHWDRAETIGLGFTEVETIAVDLAGCDGQNLAAFAPGIDSLLDQLPYAGWRDVLWPGLMRVTHPVCSR